MKDQHSAFIWIPIVTDGYNKRCFSIYTIPLRVCKAITTLKIQGMAIGPQQLFEKAIVFLPTLGSRTSPGLELVAISRAMNPDCILFVNVSSEWTETEI